MYAHFAIVSLWGRYGLTGACKEVWSVTSESIKSIRGQLREALDELDELDEMEAWDSKASKYAKACLLDVVAEVDLQKEYYQRYRGIILD